jgi:cytochrome b subunit of formate dehydrogenase
MSEYVVRFSLRERIEHSLVGVLFVVLAATGLSQEYFSMSWAAWMLGAMGGIDRVRWVHRYCGLVFSVVVAEHLFTAFWNMSTGRARPSMVPTRKDFEDAVTRYYLRLSDQPARFDSFDYRQKFEYWGMVFGSLVIVVTGLMLYFPLLTTRFLPGQLIPAALMAHGKEGLLAFLVVITWHLYNAHFSPEAFPFDASIFTGKLSRERMEKEHPLEYERMLAASEDKPEDKPQDKPEDTPEKPEASLSATEQPGPPG